MQTSEKISETIQKKSDSNLNPKTKKINQANSNPMEGKS